MTPAFHHVDTWIFDLDNTLYPAHHNLFAQIDERMRRFIERLLRVGSEEARRIQKDYYVAYGTTLAGLMALHDLDPAEFLIDVHDIDVSGLRPDPKLAAGVARLRGDKVIFTNGSRGHAENVLRQLGLTEHFSEIFDIESVNFIPKPHRPSYEEMVARSGLAPTRAAMVEDIARNLIAPHEMGMTTVWVRSGVGGAARHERLSHEGADGPHVHHATDDLATFLHGI